MTTLTPDKIPTDATTFRKWADAACTNWPGDLKEPSFRNVVKIAKALSLSLKELAEAK